MALAQAVCTACTSSSEMDGTKGTWVSEEDFHKLNTCENHTCEEKHRPEPRPRCRGMVQEDANITVSILLVAKRILHLRLASISAAGEIVVAHGDGRVAIHLNLVVVENDVSPALATVDGEARVLLMTVLHGFLPNKIRHSIGGCWSELGFHCLGRLEQHFRVAVAIEFTSCLGSGCHIITCVRGSTAWSLNRRITEAFPGFCSRREIQEISRGVYPCLSHCSSRVRQAQELSATRFSCGEPPEVLPAVPIAFLMG